MAQPPVMDLDLEQLAATCGQPLAGDSPAGENARYDQDYDAVKVEIDKLTALSAGEEGVDWAKVVTGSAGLLSEKTKDLNLAAFLALGLFRVEGYAGLACGLQIILDLMDNLWEQAFPPLKRMKARANVFNWIEERIGEVVPDRKPEDDEAEAVRRCQELAQKLAQAVGEKVKVPVTGFSGLRGALKAWVDELPQPEPEPEAEPEAGDEEAEPEAPAQPAQAEPAPASPPPPRAGAPEQPKKLQSLDQGLELARRLVNMLRGLDPSSPLPYRLARVLKWDVIEELPPAQGGRTQIPAPREEDVDSLTAMAGASNWPDLAEEAESQFLSGGTFFLDLQRYLAQALEGMGAGGAAKAVAGETARFVQRLAGVEEYSFADSRPFADPATRDWLAQAQAELGGAADASAPVQEEPWRREALALAGQGDLEGALKRLQEAVRAAPGPRQALERRLAAAGLCLDYGRPAWALPILEDLAGQLEQARLVDWAPEVFAQVYAGLVRVYQARAEEDELDRDQRQRLEEARRRLFETDMALAARLSQE